tara:strand:+ start:623 stop:1618 length:996 start_codon:yes stop_codon:yes gene_type:complete
MNITCARLRSNVKYEGPLQTVLDSFLENYVRWMKDNPQHTYDTYNISFDGTRPKRTPETIESADVIVIPSDSEFRYHGELQMNPKDLEKSQSHMDKIIPFFENKHVIVLRSDRGDTESLYREHTLKNTPLKSYTEIDEIDFPANIHGMKYHFITEKFNNAISEWFPKEYRYDFGYWGRMKTGCDRDKLLRKIYRDHDISTVLIGGFPSGVQRQASWIKSWDDLYPLLEGCKATLCFNWKDPTATTSRYPEALAIGMIPFVYRDYDKNNTYNITDWQRVEDFDDFKKKIDELKNLQYLKRKLDIITHNYKQKLISKNGYYDIFKSKMNKAIA